MEFVDFKAEVVDDTAKLELDYEEDIYKIFLDDRQQEQDTSINFYRKFQNQPHEISDALNDRSEDNCKLNIRDLQPEMYWEIYRDCTQFDEFEDYKNVTKRFKKILCSFERDSKDSFYNAILYGLVRKLLQNKEKKVHKNIIQQIPGK